MRLAQPWRSSCRLFSCIGGDSRSRVLDLAIGNGVLRLSGASSFVQHHVVPAPCGLRSRGLHLREAHGSLLIHSNHYSPPACSFAAIISCKQENHWCKSSETSLFSHKHSTMAPITATAGGEGDRTPDDRKGFQIVVAATRSMGIGKDGQLPWKLPTDMKFFKKITSYTASSSKKNAVIMGRNTWESIPEKFRPLPGRLNVVLSRSIKSIDSHDDVIVSDSLDAALALLASPPHSTVVESVFVIGGGQVYREAMVSSLCEVIYLTEVETEVECDTYMPAVDGNIFRIWAASSPMVENGLRFSFLTYIRGLPKSSQTKPEETRRDIVESLPKFVLESHDEYQYLHMIEDIINTGNVKGDRTGTGTISKFGCQMRFNLRKSFPLLTTKRTFWRGVVEELLWFISGSTNAKVLQEKGIHIWDGNASREYLDSLGFTEREEGDLGPVYGFQWRHFGAKYTDMHADYTGQGFDQLADVINKIKTSPDDRRILLSAWNPSDLELMALPPCHMFAQFYVANGELSCQMYQRSCDMGLGVPFNIASYALLTCILAHVCSLVPGDFVHVLGDAHVYKNHVEPLQEQLQNVPRPFPCLQIKTSNQDIDSFTASDFELIGYESYKKITMKMAV